MNPGFAPAKINLWLHTGRRRPDGYHELSSLIVFARDTGDEVSARAVDPAQSGALTLDVTGPQAGALRTAGRRNDPADNLVIKAAMALDAAAGGQRRGARLGLRKSLPVAAGIGGGSADAAAALRLLNTLWSLDWPSERLEQIGAGIGADVPVCVRSRPSFVQGAGERVGMLPAWPQLHAVLVNPRVPLSTAEVFARHAAAPGASPALSLNGARGAAGAASALVLIRAGRNDLEPAALALAPPVAEALAALRAQENCILARMSGSGATCFGLYGNAGSAARARARIARASPRWWTAATRLGGT